MVDTNPFSFAKGSSKKVFAVASSTAIIAVLSASLVSPMVIPKINSILDSIPILRNHASLSSALAGVIIFGIANTIGKKNKTIGAVVIGIAGAFILSAVLPLYSSITTKGAN